MISAMLRINLRNPDLFFMQIAPIAYLFFQDPLSIESMKIGMLESKMHRKDDYNHRQMLHINNFIL